MNDSPALAAAPDRPPKFQNVSQAIIDMHAITERLSRLRDAISTPVPVDVSKDQPPLDTLANLLDHGPETLLSIRGQQFALLDQIEGLLL